METSAFLYENLPYSILLWLHFGTSLLISYSFFFYVLPIVYNIVVLFLPSFKFGFKDAKLEADTGGLGSGLPTIPVSLIKTLDDSKVFAGIFSRNPKLFESIPLQEVKSFFSNLDDKLNNILTDLKGLPTSDDESEKKDEEGLIKTETEGILKSSESSVNQSDTTFESEVEQDSIDNSDSDKEKKSEKTGKKKLLLFGNLIFFAAIIGVNLYSYFYYNSLLSDFFDIKTGRYKYSSEEYQLNYTKLKTIKDKEKVELIKNMNIYVDIINSVKTEQKRRELMEAKKGGKK